MDMRKEEVQKKKRSYEELTISDDFIFFVVMQDEELCKEMLEIILDVKIRKLVYTSNQKDIKVAYDGKGVRLDVYVEDDKNTIYNLEMQAARRDNLPKRSRYYQSMIDKDSLRKTQSYDALNETIIIFVCRFDLFGLGRAVYTFKNMCKEAEGLELGDETTKIFINSTAVIKESVKKGLQISSKLGSLLEYIETGKVTDEYTKKLDKAVINVKKDSEWRDMYMLYELNIQDAKQEGIAIGKEEGIAIGKEKGITIGEEVGTKLCEILVSEGRIEEITRISQDAEYREKLLKEYGLKE